jgi:hypothetical protein
MVVHHWAYCRKSQGNYFEGDSTDWKVAVVDMEK